VERGACQEETITNMVESNAVVTASDGGLAGRPDTRIAENLYVVGDWAGKEGLLSNASVASAKRASELLLKG